MTTIEALAGRTWNLAAEESRGRRELKNTTTTSPLDRQLYLEPHWVPTPILEVTFNLRIRRDEGTQTPERTARATAICHCLLSQPQPLIGTRPQVSQAGQ
jgi:hypothetical protein